MARGRKSLFREEYIQLAENYALLGATDDELADFFGVSKQTLNKWKKDYPEFLDSLKRGKDIADSNVASKLYNRAIGYDFEETHTVCKNGLVVVKQVQHCSCFSLRGSLMNEKRWKSFSPSCVSISS